MTYEELEKRVLALSPAERKRLFDVLQAKPQRTEVREASAAYVINEEVAAMEIHVQQLLEKLSHLPPDRQAEVGDFIEFLHQRELAQLMTKDCARASEASFAKVWDNDDDARYDEL